MNWFFDMDKPLMRGLSTVTDLIILNFLTLLCCLPVFTVGAAFSALYTVAIRVVRNEEGGIVKDFFRAFRSNFKKSTLLWIPFLLLAVMLFFDYVLAEVFFPAFLAVVAALAVILLVMFFYVFALQARYENPLAVTLKNAAMLAIGYFPKTAGMVIFALIYWIGCLNYFHVAGPLLIMFGLSLPIYVNAIFMNGIFNNLENKEQSSNI